jgi:hypothetical protein
MKTINLDGKKFKLLVNSEHGQVTDKTIFEYRQTNNKFTAHYFDEEIIHGSIVGIIHEPKDIYLVYHCILKNGQIRAGEASAEAIIENGKMKLKMNWKWLTGGNESGFSEYIEI